MRRFLLQSGSSSLRVVLAFNKIANKNFKDDFDKNLQSGSATLIQKLLTNMKNKLYENDPMLNELGILSVQKFHFSTTQPTFGKKTLQVFLCFA